MQYTANTFDFNPPTAQTSRAVDLDGMTMMAIALPPSSTNDGVPALDLTVDDVTNETTQDALMQAPDSPATAAFAPLLQEMEMFGRVWNCPSPIVLHINDNPPSTSVTTTSSPSNMTVCPIWRKSNEIFGRIFSSRLPSSTGVSDLSLGDEFDWGLEAGLLFKGIKDGWKDFDSWEQSPVLRILKAVDQFLFAKSGKMERLAASYKSFKLLKVSRLLCCWIENSAHCLSTQYYINPTKEELAKVPTWLRPRYISHPYILL